MDEVTQLKQLAAARAVEFIRSGMIIGLGHGSTALLAVRLIAELLAGGKKRNLLGIPCSQMIEDEARRLGLPLTTLEEHRVVDLTIDGADEVSPALDLIKGGGGALLREKIVAQASRREIIIVDESKISPALGTRHRLPVEVLPFGWSAQATFLRELGAKSVELRLGNDEVFTTQQGNVILDCDFGPIREPEKLAAALERRAGIIEHGLFLGIATDVIIAGVKGLRLLKRGQLATHQPA
jgi:ribose 5-phosphate isomerase A